MSDEEAGAGATSDKDASAAAASDKDAGTAAASDKDAGTAAASDKDAGTAAASDKDAGTAATSDKDAGTAAASDKEAGTAAASDKDAGTAATSDKDAGAPATTEQEAGAAAMTDGDPVTYEAGWDSTPGAQAALLSGMVYCWWLFIGGTFEILFGGMYLSGSAADFHVSTPWLQLIYVLIGVSMVSLGFGILRLERWVYWAAWLFSFALLALSVIEIVRWLNGTPLTLETVFFDGLNVLFIAYNVFFLLQKDTRRALHFRLFGGSPFSPGMALCGIVLITPSLAVTLFVNHIDKHLSDPVLLLVYLLCFVLMIVMAFMALKLQRWVYWLAWVWTAILTGLSIYVIAHELTRGLTASSVDVQGLIFSGVNLVVVVTLVYYLVLKDVREAVFHARPKQAVFSPPTLIGGFSLAVLAFAIYLLPGQLGKVSIAYALFGLVMGTVVGLLPGADPANRISGYFVGVLLAFASYVARGGLLPYTKGSSAVVVLLMLVVITGITAVVRSRAWFVLMLLGAGTLYGLVELQFQAAPSGYLASAGLAFAGILLGFGVGYAVSSMLQLELVPYKSPSALASETIAGSGATSGDAGRDSTQLKADAA
jgi:hypothetical protein